MFLFEDMTTLVLWLWATVTAINIVFVGFLFYRRLAHQRYYSIKDSARERYEPVITGFQARRLTVEDAADLLAGATVQAEYDTVEELLLDAITDSDRERLTELLLATGYVERWCAQAFGRRRGPEVLRAAIHGKTPPKRETKLARFVDRGRSLKMLSVPRAIAVDHLGWLAPPLVRVLAAEALTDPSLEVRSTAIAVIGRNRDHQALPLLVEELARAVAQKSDVSLRTIKVALVAYECDDLTYFVPHLSHELPRVRFFLVDAISQICSQATREGGRTSESSRRALRQSSSRHQSASRHQSSSGRTGSSRSMRALMLNKNDFSREFYAVFLEQIVKDPFADVRARCSGVIRHFRDSKAAEALRVLVRDENEFVRLHAARACADRAYSGLVGDLARLLTDPKWRVREAAAQALRAMGSDGIFELYRRFVTTEDRYASEQITEEIQRSGAIEDLAASLVSTNVTLPLSEAVCRKMILIGKTSLLLNALASQGVPIEARAFIMNAMLQAPPPEFLDIVRRIADSESGPLAMKAQSILEASSTRTQAASGVRSA